MVRSMAADPFVDYSVPSASLRFALHQALKDVHTCLPGLVETYDPERRRARVRPAISLLAADGRTIPRPPIADVPVVFPTGGGFALTFPLEPGDPVLLVYAQRGISDWKRTHQLSPPDVDGFFSAKDAIAIPGFGRVGSWEPDHEITVSSSGIAIKTSGILSIEAHDVRVNGTSILDE